MTDEEKTIIIEEKEEKEEEENLEDAELDTTGITINSEEIDPEVSQVAGPYDANQIQSVCVLACISAVRPNADFIISSMRLWTIPSTRRWPDIATMWM